MSRRGNAYLLVVIITDVKDRMSKVEGSVSVRVYCRLALDANTNSLHAQWRWHYAVGTTNPQKINAEPKPPNYMLRRSHQPN